MSQPYSDEIDAFNTININASSSLIRRICLNGNQHPLTFARVIIPEATYLNYKHELDTLGNAPIGNTILYADSTITRNEFYFKRIENHDPLFQEIQTLTPSNPKEIYWARRSMFKLPKGHLLISELILNSIPNYPD